MGSPPGGDLQDREEVGAEQRIADAAIVHRMSSARASSGQNPFGDLKGHRPGD